MAEPIRDPFDTTQAIMPSGRLGMPVYVSTGWAPIDRETEFGFGCGRRLIGWSDGILGALHTTPKEEPDR